MLLMNRNFRPVSDNYNSSTEERYAVNVVDQPGVSAIHHASRMPSELLWYLILLISHSFSWVFVYYLLQGIKKTLVLKEIPEDGVSKLLSDKESLATCDIAIFVHDR